MVLNASDIKRITSVSVGEFNQKSINSIKKRYRAFRAKSKGPT